MNANRWIFISNVDHAESSFEGVLKVINDCIQKFVDALIALKCSTLITPLHDLVPNQEIAQTFLLFLLRDISTAQCIFKFGLKFNTRSRGSASLIVVVPGLWKEINADNWINHGYCIRDLSVCFSAAQARAKPTEAGDAKVVIDVQSQRINLNNNLEISKLANFDKIKSHLTLIYSVGIADGRRWWRSTTE
jgi:hypothetical protein